MPYNVLGFSYVLKGVDEVFLPSRDISPSVLLLLVKGALRGSRSQWTGINGKMKKLLVEARENMHSLNDPSLPLIPVH